jgi:aspartyl-tRNA(Asn)/glutamyl-tRNA(Gln) amidotransferase subunit B
MGMGADIPAANPPAANEQSVVDYKAGKENAMKFLMGQVMSASKGKANPQIVLELLKKALA